jgi:hypothetical protein
MSTKILWFCIKVTILIIACCGLCICVFIYPIFFHFFSIGKSVSDYYLWALLIFFWMVSIPCFIILVFIWKIANFIKTGSVFTHQVAKIAKLCSLILFGDIALFFTGNIIFFLIEPYYYSIFAFISIFLILTGLTLALFAAILSHYINKAAMLQEECEGTI